MPESTKKEKKELNLDDVVKAAVLQRLERYIKGKVDSHILHTHTKLTDSKKKENLKEDEVNELSRKTLGSYIKGALKQGMIDAHEVGANRAPHKNKIYQKHLHRAKQRTKGIKLATDKLVNEISKEKMIDYVDTANDHKRIHKDNLNKVIQKRGNDWINDPKAVEDDKKMMKRHRGIQMAIKKIHEEEPTNVMGNSSSTSGTGHIDTFDPMLFHKKKKIIKRKNPVEVNV